MAVLALISNSADVFNGIISKAIYIKNFNLMVNTESFAEMSMQNIISYMNFLRNNCEPKNLFYCCNRVEKYMRNKNEKNNVLNAIRFTEYPWSQKDEIFLYKIEGFYSRFTSVPFFSKAVISSWLN